MSGGFWGWAGMPMRWMLACTPFGARAAISDPEHAQRMIDKYEDPEDARDEFVRSIWDMEQRRQQLEARKLQALNNAQKAGTKTERDSFTRQALEYRMRIERQKEPLSMLYQVRTELGIMSDRAALANGMASANALARYNNIKLSPAVMSELDFALNDAVKESRKIAESTGTPLTPETGSLAFDEVDLEAELSAMLAADSKNLAALAAARPVAASEWDDTRRSASAAMASQSSRRGRTVPSGRGSRKNPVAAEHYD